MTCSTCCQPLSDAQRVEYTASLFGVGFPLTVEPAVFRFARLLSSDYDGGLWDFYALSNGGFYMAPSSDGLFLVRSENGFEGELSAQAFGITACLYAYSQLSFTAPGGLDEKCAEQYHLLREHALDRREARAIFAAID